MVLLIFQIARSSGFLEHCGFLCSSWRLLEREAFGLLSPKKALAVASNNSLKGRSQPQVREHEGENSQQYRLVVKFFFRSHTGLLLRFLEYIWILGWKKLD